MKENKNISSLKSHKFSKGLIQPPMNTLPNSKPVSWTDDRLPEYLWIGLILMSFSRTKGIEIAGKILKEISQINKNLLKPKLSEILSLPNYEQEKIYKTIVKNVNFKILAPLTVIFKNNDYPIFNKYFYCHEMPTVFRIDTIKKSIKLYYNHQSYEATDLRFVVLSMMVFQDKLRVFQGSTLPEVFERYPYTSHDDEKMRMYRPSIRATEMMDIENLPNKQFIDFFWKEIGLKTSCNTLVIGFKKEENEMDYKKYIIDYQYKLNHLITEKKELVITNDKFNVIIGTITYSLKIFNDVIEKDLSDSILGRHAYRTILETFINIKYLLKLEQQNPNVWLEYKLYGIGKYKLPLLKERENSIQNNTHFADPLAEVIINEIIWEEFLDIDTRYFDNKKIKEKFEEVGEKYLYEVLYEYDNNFIHGFWGAVRESSMLHCDNATHKFHSVPDINFEQKLSSVNSDIYKIMDKFYNLIEESF